MIYFFKGCKDVCLAPCKMFGAGCKCCEDFFKPILDQPLGCFVVLSWVSMSITAVCGVLGLLGGGCGSIKVFSMGLVALAIMHAVGSYYLQRRLVTNLQKSGSTASGSALAQEAGRMFLYDVGFCVYIIVFVCSFFYGLFCMSSLNCSDGEKSNSTMMMLGALMLIFHIIGAFNYAMCWYFGNCCLGGLQSSGLPGQAKQQPPVQGMVVGAR